MHTPVIYEAASEARKTHAHPISSGVPSLPNGTLFSASALTLGSAKFEYNFLHFDATVDRFVTFSAAFVPSPLVRDVETDLHLVKVGLNYRF